MPTTYGTGNPIGSNDVRDFSDNVVNLDYAMNSSAISWVDRLGVERKTIPGAIQNIESILSTSGYNFKGEYAAGISLLSIKDMVRYDGVLYSNAGPFPKTTSGVFANDGPWVALSASTGIYLYSFIATNGQKEFTIGAPVVPGTVPIVFKRGVYQQFGSSYSISTLDGKKFIFTEPMESGDAIQIMAMSGADAVIKGDYQAFLYRNSATAPSAPSGQNPSGWVSSPVTPSDDEFTYVSTIRKSGSDGAIIGSWSAPSRFSGSRGIQGIQGGQGIQGVQGEVGPQGATGPQGKSVVDVIEVSSDASTITYKFELSDGSFTSDYAVPKGASVQDLELVSKIGKVATYRFLLTTGGYTNTFVVNDGLDGTGSVISVNGISPDVSGDVTLTPADVGADATGSATTAVSDHVAIADPHSQYDYRWSTATENTGDLSGSRRVRWLADTSSARNRTIGPDVTDLLVKDATGKAGTNKVTITAPAGKTINGAATEVIDADFGWVQYTLVGTDFKTIGGQ